MRQPLLLLSPSLAVLLSANVLAQGTNPVPIQFQPDPVLVQTGTEIVFTVQTVPQVFSMTWIYKGNTLGTWVPAGPSVNSVAQFAGRITISATQLRIGIAQLRDAGNYTVEVTPSATTGLTINSRSIQLRVFDAVNGVSLFVPTVAVEGRNVSLQCTWTAGTEITVQWGKGGVAVTADSRITFSGGFLIINPARRNDAGVYTCTVSNLVSAQTATQSLTVYYGPDTPVLTKDAPKKCVGGGDVLVGQTVRLTCVSDSLPPALFSWQRDGQPVTSGQPDSGVLSLQTFSTNESGRYVCTATNSITGGTSAQGTDLAIVGICLNVGEVVGIVIGCLLLIIIIVLLIVLIVVLVRRRRAQERQMDTVFVQKTNPNPRPIPPDPQPNGARDLGQGPHPPLYHTHTRQPNRSYAAPRESRGNPQTLNTLNGLHNSDTRQHNGRTHTDRLLHNSIQNTNSDPHNGIDNPAFTHTDAQIANTHQQNPNILIQTGTAQGGAQPSAVHLSLNTLPQTAQQNSNAQIPIIHVNLNSYSTNGQQTQQDSSFPLASPANDNINNQLNLIRTRLSNSRMQSGQSYHIDHQLNGHIEAGPQNPPGLIPTGYTHHNSNNASQRNANTQTYQQEAELHSRSDRNTGRPNTAAGSSLRQMPWDRLRGTPAYPSGRFQRRGTSPEFTPDYTADYTISPPIPNNRKPNRSQPQPQDQSTSRSRAPLRQDPPSVDRQTRSRSADLRGPNTRSATQLEAAHNTQRSPHTQRESAQRDIRGSTAPRQETTRSYNPRALPLMSQQISAPQGADTRALADPNHLSQAHMAQQHRAAPIQTPPQGLGTQTQPVIHGANQPRQGGTAPVPFSFAQPNPSNLTQAALATHTERAQTFQNRRQQTQAALLHPRPQAQAPAAEDQHPPTPPPVIPIAQFQTLPRSRTQATSPVRGAQPPRPPVNIPVTQRPLEVRQHHTLQPRPAAHARTQDHAKIRARTHANTQAHNHKNPTHFTQPRQTHRGRPR